MARKKTSQETQAKWEERIKKAKKFREEDFENKFQTKLGLSYYEGNQRPAGWASHEWITINKIFSHLRSQLPSLYSVNPYFFIKLKRSYKPNPMDIAALELKAEKRQAMLNYLKNELDLKSKARLGIQDAHFEYGVIKTHYSADMVTNPDKGKPMMSEEAEEENTPLLNDDGQPLIEPNEIPINDRYNITRVRASDFLFSADAGTLPDKWHWVAEKIVLTEAEAKKNKWISDSALKDAPKKQIEKTKDEDGYISSSFIRSQEEHKKDPDSEVYVGWEIYDLDKEEWLIILEDAPKCVMMPSPLPAGTEKHPYSILRFALRENSPYPIPMVSQALDVQKELNLARSRIMTHRKRFNRKYVMARPAFQDVEAEAAKLEHGEDGTVIITDSPDARAGVDPINEASLDQQSFQEIALLSNDIIEELGSTGESRGVAQSETATQASILDRQMEVKEGDMMSNVIDWITDIAKKLDQLVQAHVSQDEAVKVTGVNGEEFWQMVSMADFDAIEGEYEYSVNTGSTMPRLPSMERQQWMAFLQVLGSYPQLMSNRRLMMKMAEMHHIEDDPMIEELVKLGEQARQEAGAMPQGGQGSIAGVSEDNPIAKVIGAATGVQGGTNNGGGGGQIG